MMRVRTMNAALAATGGLIALAVTGVSCTDESGKTTVPPGGLVCGAGTHEQDGECRPDTQRETTVQTGQLAPIPENPKPTGWDTTYSQKVGVKLFATYPESDVGPNAWDVAAHPLVFITTVGPGYGGFLGDVKWPGVAVVDANTYEVVAYAAYNMANEGWKEEDVFEPHGMGVSSDGKWIYLPTGKGRADGRVLIINARTLKLDKQLIMREGGRPHHAKCFKDSAGNERVLVYGWGQPPFVLDPKADPADGISNKIVGGVDFNDTGMEGYLWFVTPDGKEMWGSGRWRLGNVSSEVHGNIIMTVDTATWKLKSYIPFPDESTPVWVEFSAENKFAYVSGGHSSTVLKYDRVEKKRVGIARAGVEGPYGVRLNWDGKEIYTVGKGEGSHNQGKELGLVDATKIGTMDRPITQYTTDCVRGDHATLHPTPDKKELWLSCNSSFEVVVFDMANKKVKTRIPMPNQGSTHSGSFVQYKNDFTGAVLSDQNGLHGTALETQAKMQAGGQ
ncbi:MAG: hypothetical protein HY698_07835 [Deltaproteobacteria bacterium]|nr:hypothetical protein [Deltaproteobacteria bacterium]